MEDKPKEKYIKNFFQTNLLIIAVSLLVIAVRIGYLPTKVPLYYSLPWGESQLADKNLLFFIPTASLIILGLNYFLGRLFGRKEDYLLAVVSAGFSLLFAVLGLISLLKIIVLVG